MYLVVPFNAGPKWRYFQGIGDVILTLVLTICPVALFTDFDMSALKLAINSGISKLCPGGIRAGGIRAGGIRAGGIRAGGIRAGGIRAGIKRAGVKRAGVKRAGVKRAGVKRAGVKRAGVKRAGVKRAGVKRAGVTRYFNYSVDLPTKISAIFEL